MNELDQFIKHKLHCFSATSEVRAVHLGGVSVAKAHQTFCINHQAKFYLRYCDDFVILGNEEKDLAALAKPMGYFLSQDLKLFLHPDKIILRKLNQGIDFLGYVVLPNHRVLRTKTKRRMMKRVCRKNLASYLGLLKYCDSYKLQKELWLKNEEFWHRIEKEERD